MHIVITGKYSSQFPTLLLTITQIFTVAILCVISAFFFEDWTQMLNGAVLQKAEVWSALLITSLLATAFAFLVQTNFQKYTTATRVALIFAMEPVFAALTAYIWTDERLTISALVGCLLILLGMILAELPISFSFRKKFSSNRQMTQ